MIGIVGAGIGDVVEDFFAREAVAVGDAEEADRSKGAFGVDVEAFAFAAAHVEGKLTGDGKGVADLRFARSEFTKDFSDRPGFDAAGQKCIELFGAGGDGDELGTTLMHLGGGGEAHGYKFGC